MGEQQVGDGYHSGKPIPFVIEGSGKWTRTIDLEYTTFTFAGRSVPGSKLAELLGLQPVGRDGVNDRPA